MFRQKNKLLIIIPVILFLLATIYVPYVLSVANDNILYTYNLCNVKDYGAIGDGSSNDSIALQNAANDAFIKGLTLYIPEGNYLITKDLVIKTSVECQGKILIENGWNTPYIYIGWNLNDIKIDPNSLSDLTKGSNRISGLNNYSGGTIVLESSEKLIMIDNNSYYTKNESSNIISNDGQISPALDCTYEDLSKLTVAIHPYEPPLVINGLNVEAFGNVIANQSLVCSYRDNVTYNNLKIVNMGNGLSSESNVGLELRGCNVTLNNPVIDNFVAPNGDGYGIAYGRTSNFIINNAIITNCSSHAVAGRHNKDMIISGGYFCNSIDDHWGKNLIIDGATIEDYVSYAGTDITITNCNYTNCTRILVVRGDTPELMGKVIIDNIIAKSAKNFMLGFGYMQAPQTTNYGRTLSAPDYVSITNVTADIPSGGYINVLGTAYPSYITNSVDPIRFLHAENIQTVRGVAQVRLYL